MDTTGEQTETREPELEEFWESHYRAADQVWSGRANQVLVDLASELPVGRALDLGCGEGGDAIWLAGRGWQVTGVDISTIAVERARAAARAAGLADRIRFETADLGSWTGAAEFDLVSACFFHSPVEVDRAGVFRRAAATVAVGGHLLIVSHGDFPPWGNARHDHPDYRFLSPREEIDAIDLDRNAWEVIIAENRSREATGPDGEQGKLDDAVVLLHRRSG